MACRRVLRVAASMFMFALSFNALAQCVLPTKAVKPAVWSGSHFGGPRLLRAALEDRNDVDRGPSIVGMWHVVFVAQTLNGDPVNFVLDDAIAVWHSDHTEIMNSSRPAQDGNFCLGVWDQTGKLGYYLNHIPWAGNDPTNAPGGIGNPQAGVQLTEKVNLSSDGNGYSGTFTLTAYAANKQPVASFTGVLAATRITTSTSITELF
jgi:hypothetical protein